MITFFLIVIGILIIYGIYITKQYLAKCEKLEEYRTETLKQGQELLEVWGMHRENLYQSQTREKELKAQIQKQQDSIKMLTDMGERMSRTLQKMLSSEGGKSNEAVGK